MPVGLDGECSVDEEVLGVEIEVEIEILLVDGNRSGADGKRDRLGFNKDAVFFRFSELLYMTGRVLPILSPQFLRYISLNFLLFPNKIK